MCPERVVMLLTAAIEANPSMSIGEIVYAVLKEEGKPISTTLYNTSDEEFCDKLGVWMNKSEEAPSEKKKKKATKRASK